MASLSLGEMYMRIFAEIESNDTRMMMLRSDIDGLKYAAPEVYNQRLYAIVRDFNSYMSSMDSESEFVKNVNDIYKKWYKNYKDGLQEVA